MPPAKKTKPGTVAAYIASLPATQRETVKAMRAFVRKHVPSGYEEAMNWGVISWQVPLTVLPDTYNGHPLTYVGLAGKKSGYRLYLMAEYAKGAQAALGAEFAREGKKLSMGKCCVVFQHPDKLALGPLAKSIGRVPMKTYVAMYRKSREKRA